MKNDKLTAEEQNTDKLGKRERKAYKRKCLPLGRHKWALHGAYVVRAQQG